MSRDAWLQKVLDGLPSGHTWRLWTKGRWGFHTSCLVCGAFVAVTVSTKRVRGAPHDTCEERSRMLEEYEDERRASLLK